jgi:hypothetical protein
MGLIEFYENWIKDWFVDTSCIHKLESKYFGGDHGVYTCKKCGNKKLMKHISK